MDLSQFPDNDPFYEFFKRLVPNMPDMPQEDTESDALNFGSGFIISKNGYILTNTHVVAGMGNIKVLLNDKREYTAKLVGSDAQSDVALLKIEPQEDLPVVKIGNPKDLKPGEWVAAIGAPFGSQRRHAAFDVAAEIENVGFPVGMFAEQFLPALEEILLRFDGNVIAVALPRFQNLPRNQDVECDSDRRARYAELFRQRALGRDFAAFLVNASRNPFF